MEDQIPGKALQIWAQIPIRNRQQLLHLLFNLAFKQIGGISDEQQQNTQFPLESPSDHLHSTVVSGASRAEPREQKTSISVDRTGSEPGMADSAMPGHRR